MDKRYILLYSKTLYNSRHSSRHTIIPITTHSTGQAVLRVRVWFAGLSASVHVSRSTATAAAVKKNIDDTHY